MDLGLLGLWVFLGFRGEGLGHLRDLGLRV